MTLPMSAGFRRVIWLTLLLLSSALPAQETKSSPDIPAAGLQAEMAGNWELARDTYLKVLETSPDRVDLHRRLAEIYSRLEQPRQARQHLEQVLMRYPDDPELLSDYAQLSNWIGAHDDAEEALERLLALNGGVAATLLGLAQVESWQGKVDQSARHYRQYLEQEPDDRDAYLGYAYTQSWRGNYAEAVSLADEYLARGGEREDYNRARTRFLARAGKTDAALALADETLEADPTDYHANFSRTVAYREAGMLSAALESLARTQQCCAGQQGLEELSRFVSSDARHTLTGSISRGSDSDEVETESRAISGVLIADPDLSLTAGLESTTIEAPDGSGLESDDGKPAVDVEKSWIGLEYAPVDTVRLMGTVGSADSEQHGRIDTYAVGLDHRAGDELRWNLELDRDFHAVSPRALSRGITRRVLGWRAHWTPGMYYTVDATINHTDFSDDNEKSELSAAIRRAVARTERINLDLGVYGRWFGFDERSVNGYYSPETYRQYLLTLHAYYKLSDDDGISLVFSPGVHKDETFHSYRGSGNFSIDGTFGLYRDWMFTVHFGVVNNIGINDRTYRRKEANIGLTRRF